MGETMDPTDGPLLARRTDRIVGLDAGPTPQPSAVGTEPRLFLNRELSWLAFNERVFEEACEPSLPLFERLKFLSIVSSNLDEFFMIRVAGLKQQLRGEGMETPADGLLPSEALARISARVHALTEAQDRVWNEELLPGLAARGVRLIAPAAFEPEQAVAARQYFAAHVLPALTPLAVDPGHPFPHLKNRSLNIAVLLWKQGRKRAPKPRENLLAVVQVPAVLRRFVPLPSRDGQTCVLLSDLIETHVSELFGGYEVRQTARFRVTRNSDLLVDEEESEDLLSTIQEELHRRDLGAAVRLELATSAGVELESILTAALRLDPIDIYRVHGPLQFSDLSALADRDPRSELRVEPLAPTTPPFLRDADSVTEVVSHRDVLLHHPYESFDPVVRFIEEAAEDPEVVAVKMTMYRTSGDSPFVRALSRAVQNGKQVTALVEIKARFDEANNIAWARRLEENGVHVVYGLIGLKTHCKLALVVRREEGGIRRYVHLGTGNYNPNTARQYTDLSFFTSRPEITGDVAALFNVLTGYCDPPEWQRLAVAPFDLQFRLVALIDREAERARRGEPARIVAKMNSLVDPAAIHALYDASRAGVEIDLIVRGICCLRPGIPGISDRIRVISIVDRFLEHSRVFAFGAGAQPEVFVASADWMPRNFARRIEVMCPIEETTLRARVLDEVLGAALRDTARARRLTSDGSYIRITGETRFRSQEDLLEQAKEGRLGATPLRPVGC
jgi:polyphosphate kinase